MPAKLLGTDMPERLWSFFFRDHRLFVRYILVGIASALIEFSLFSLLYQWAGWRLLVANGLALAVAIVFNFLLHRSWTFRQKREAGRQLRRYLFMQLVAVALNNGLVWLFVERFGWYAPLAKLLEIGIVFLWSFSFSRLVVFAATDKLAPPSALVERGDEHAG